MVINKKGEFSFIENLKNKLISNNPDVVAGAGDDAAVIKTGRDKYLLASCDAQVSGVHFLPEYFKPEEIGRKAVAVNVSDIAAMGGKPTFCLVSLVLPKKTTEVYINKLYDGIVQECNKYALQIIGGNVSYGTELVVDLFILGEVKPENLLLRSGAKPGDKVLVTGNLGQAASGLQILLHKKVDLNKNILEELIVKQKTPDARLKESGVIADLQKATAMIDISDGLSTDINHICNQSHTGVVLYEDLMPVSDGVSQVAKKIGIKPYELALSGGEDYELCFTAPADAINTIIKKVKQVTGTEVTVVGEILTEMEGKWLKLKNGKKISLKPQGWDHFQ